MRLRWQRLLRKVSPPITIVTKRSIKNASVAVQWREEAPKDIVEEIYADLRGTRLEQFLYEPLVAPEMASRKPELS